MIVNLLHKIRRKWMKLRLQPISVFCLHHVSAVYDVNSMNHSDWMLMEEFTNKIQAMQRDGVAFISLTEAYNKIANDKWRNKKYAVLTFDDGYASLKEILPWLDDQHIPATLFINGKYLDGLSYRKNPQEKYLTQTELCALTSPLIEIGSHGWEHMDASTLSPGDFNEYISKNVQLLSKHPRYIPFHAYTWGKQTDATDAALLSKSIIPVYIDGKKNYNEPNKIHRKLL